MIGFGDFMIFKKSDALRLMPMPNITNPSKKNRLGLSGMNKPGIA